MMKGIFSTKTKGRIFFLSVLFLLFVLVMSAALFFGAGVLSASGIFEGDGGKFSPLFLARLSRVTAAFLVGGSLALAGCVYQSILHNPLAEPFILGVSGGAALGTGIAFASKVVLISIYMVPLFASAGALIMVAFVLLLGMTRKGDANTLLLSGVIGGTTASSILMCLISFAGTEEINSITWFLLGDLSATDPALLHFFAVFAPCIVFFLWLLSPKANAISLGEEYAKSMGINFHKNCILLLFFASLLAAGSAALSGIIGFVGLIVPHILRKWGFADQRVLFPLSFFSGGIFLTFCDLLSRILLPEREIPIGAITSLSGGAFFLYLLYAKKGSVEK